MVIEQFSTRFLVGVVVALMVENDLLLVNRNRYIAITAALPPFINHSAVNLLFLMVDDNVLIGQDFNMIPRLECYGA
jgi:hypothetical protein